MKIAVVVPTIRENSIIRFIKEWNPVFSKHNITLFIVEDNPTKTFNLVKINRKFKVFHFSWENIEKDLGSNSWIIPRRTSAIKSYGFFKAYKYKADIIIALDDDCYPIENYINNFNKKDFIKSHLSILLNNDATEDSWLSTIEKKGNIRPRGLPYINTKRKIDPDDIILSHGLWANIPDFDAKTQLKIKKVPKIENYFKNQIIPHAKYFSMCGMNIAWKRKLTPAMYFMLMGKNNKGMSWGFDRFDDIWAGVFIKKICDHLGFRINSGYPVIWHDKASNPFVNLKKEKTGVKVNEKLWEKVDNINLKSDNVKDCYKEIAKQIDGDSYFNKLRDAMIIWSDLF